ncbi:major outer membrane protein, partial [Klebsiella pneumoniae]|uniref:major outer membrane protein n=1 Tax=Klebsiella pneumoniae TaxID=573 RepID=UPI003AF5DB17
LTDDIAAIGTLDYNYYGSADDSGYGSGSSAKTSEGFYVREAYLQYEAPDFGTTIALGRQQLNTIWTDADIDGAVGMKAQIFNNSIN